MTTKSHPQPNPLSPDGTAPAEPQKLGFTANLRMWLMAGLAATVFQLSGRLCRVRIVEGEEVLRRLIAEPRPVLPTYWHNQLFFNSYFVIRWLSSRGFPLAVLISRSRDGELAARVARLFDIEPVRGSSSRGGSAALRRLYRVITSKGSSPIMIPDGPRGPLHQCKPGVVVLAQMSGAPILPLAFHAERAWRLSSWDRFIIPKPFSRVSVAVGEPLAIARKASREELEVEARRVESTLARLGETARRGADAGSE